MFVTRNNWLVVVMIIPLAGQVSGAISVDDRCEVCPSYCDETGSRHEELNCRSVAGHPSPSSSSSSPSSSSLSYYCCRCFKRLSCCANETLMISKRDALDDFKCSVITNKYGRTTLFVCVPIGLTCFVVALALFVYQRKRRRRPTNVSCSSGETQLPYPMDTVCDVSSTVVMPTAGLQTIGAVPAAAPADVVYAIPSGVHPPPPYTEDGPPPLYSDIFPS